MIHDANSWAAPVLDALWRASWQGAIFIAVIWMACKAFQKMPAWAKHWLWWVACLQMVVRLFVCISVPILPATELPADLVAVDAPAPVSSPVEVTQPLVRQMAFSTASAPAPIQLGPSPTAQEKPSIELILVSAWLLGCLAVLSMSARHLFALSRLLRRSEAPNVVTASLVQTLAAEMKLRTPRVRISKDAPCPMLAGWLKPTIILPAWATDLTGSELNLALHHELVHLQRRDLWLALLPAMVKCIYFFHPLVWLASHEASLACEEACDIETLSLGSGSPAAYARLLLHSAQTSTSTVALGTAFGFRSLHRRITMLKRLNLSAPARRTRSLTIFIALAAVCALPWSVTAQSVRRSTSKHHYSRRHAHRMTKGHGLAMVTHGVEKTSAATKVTSSYTITEVPSTDVGVTTATVTNGKITAPRWKDGQAYNVISRNPKTGNLTVTAYGNPGGKPITKSFIVAQKDGRGAVVSDGHLEYTVAQPAEVQRSDTALASPAPANGVELAVVPQAQVQGGAGSIAVQAGSPAGMGGGGFGGGGVIGGQGGGGFGGGGGMGSAIVAKPVKHQPTMSGGGFGGGGQSTGFETKHEVISTGEERVTVKFQNANLREALTSVFEAAHVNFTIKSNVSFNDIVTCGFTNASLQTVVKAILDSVDQPLTYRIEGGTYVIMAQDNTQIRAGG